MRSIYEINNKFLLNINLITEKDNANFIRVNMANLRILILNREIELKANCYLNKATCRVNTTGDEINSVNGEHLRQVHC